VTQELGKIFLKNEGWALYLKFYLLTLFSLFSKPITQLGAIGQDTYPYSFSLHKNLPLFKENRIKNTVTKPCKIETVSEDQKP
jgi:hypothetical protein